LNVYKGDNDLKKKKNEEEEGKRMCFGFYMKNEKGGKNIFYQLFTHIDRRNHFNWKRLQLKFLF
jgi:hypothetical protein